MIKLSFLLSNWYSGATLFSILLNNHSRLVCNGETFPFQYDTTKKDIYNCSCGRHMLECDFYNNTTQSLKNSNGTWSDSFRVMPNIANSELLNKIVCSFKKQVWLRDLFLLPGLPLRKKLNDYIQAHLQFYEKALNYSDGIYYVDGTKSIRRAELFVKYVFPQVKVIYLIRDGRGFCWSYLKNNQLSLRYLGDAAAAWLDYIDMVDTFTKRYPRLDLKIVRYEDLCHKPEEIFVEVCNFLNIDFEESMVGTPTEHHMLGNEMRLNFDGKVKEDISWKEKFSLSDIANLEKLMKPALERYGYHD